MTQISKKQNKWLSIITIMKILTEFTMNYTKVIKKNIINARHQDKQVEKIKMKIKRVKVN